MMRPRETTFSGDLSLPGRANAALILPLVIGVVASLYELGSHATVAAAEGVALAATDGRDGRTEFHKVAKCHACLNAFSGPNHKGAPR